MSRRRRDAAVRDQEASPFVAILTALCETTGASAAALVDKEGETVDYAGFRSPFEIRVAAAEWRLALDLTHQASVPGWTDVDELWVRARRRSYAVITVADGYAIVLELPRYCSRVSRRALAQAVRELGAEAGLAAPKLGRGARWTYVQVRVAPDDPLRPVAIWHEQAWEQVTVLGRYRAGDLEGREVGYLARLMSGAEFSLVREVLGYWFVDALVGSGRPPVLEEASPSS
jgi:hypothetical protein